MVVQCVTEEIVHWTTHFGYIVLRPVRPQAMVVGRGGVRLRVGG